MAKIVAPFSCNTLLDNFGITSNNLSALAPSASTGLVPAQGGGPGVVPSNLRDDAGVLITSSNWRTISFFSGCYYVAGSVQLRVTAAAQATAAAVENSLTVTGIAGRVAAATVSAGKATITTTFPTGATVTCTADVVVTSTGSGTSVSYSFAYWNVYTATAGVFKSVATTNRGLEATDSYSGWQGAGTTVQNAGVDSGGYTYCVIFIRNRN